MFRSQAPPLPMVFFDAHNHLQNDSLAPHFDAIVAGAQAAGVCGVVVNGTSPRDWPRVAEMARRWPEWVLPAFGLHPWEVSGTDLSPDWAQTLRAYLTDFPAAPVGEIGLDFAKDPLEKLRKNHAESSNSLPVHGQNQHHALAVQLAIARELRRPVILHCVRAFGALETALRANPLPSGFLLHDYSGSVEHLRLFARLGGYFSCNIRALWPRNKKRHAALLAIPADRLLLETDAPHASASPGDSPLSPSSFFICNLLPLYAAAAHLRTTAPAAFTTRIEANFLHFYRANLNDNASEFGMLCAPFL